MNDRRVAVLGTGKMGSAIATRLAHEGFEVVLWNRTRSRAQELGLGTVVDTPAAAVLEADMIVSSLTGPEAVLATYLGPEGALSAGHGKTFIEMSTAGPDVVPALATHVAAAGGRFVEAPIMGAPPLMRAGQATVLAGGTAADVAAAGAVRGVGMSEAVNDLARAGMTVRRARGPFRQRTARLSLRVDVTNVAQTLEQLDGPGAR